MDRTSTSPTLRLVVHIGPHKTGTTYLQSNFARQAEELKRRGWLYPRIGERVSTAHHDFSDSRRQFLAGEGRTVDDFRRMIAKADEQGLNLLLSSEGFQKWRANHFDAIRKLAGGRSLHLVYVLRDPLDKFYSMWAQLVKSGLTESLPERMAGHFDDPDGSKLLNPLVEIQPVFGAANVDYTVLLYDELRRREQDLYVFFLQEILGLGDLTPPVPTANERLPIEMTEFIRLLSIESGYHRGREQRDALNIGNVMRFVFTEADKARIVETMQRHGAPAKHALEISRTTPEYLALQERLVRLLGAHMRPPPGPQLFSHETVRWTHYDAAELRAIPQVRAVLAKAVHKARPGSPRLVLANFVKRLLLRWRVLRKQLWFGQKSASAGVAGASPERAGRGRRRARR